MDPVTAGALITAVIPFVTAGIKHLFKTKVVVPDDATRAGVHALIPLFLGIFSTGLYVYVQTRDWKVALAAGLGSGGVASSVRDVDKNLTGIVQSLYLLMGKDATDRDAPPKDIKK